MLMTKSSLGAMEGPVLDDVIHRLLDGRRGGRQVKLSESEIRQLCIEAKHVFRAQPNLLDLHAPIKICGDIHGQYLDLLKLFEKDAKINRVYGFYDECKRRFNVRLWKTFCDSFNFLPMAAVIDEKILCMHGGLSPELNSLDQIRDVKRPTEIPDYGLLCDLLWSDPDPKIQGWGESDRGISVTFGADKLEEFLDQHELDLVCRGHQVVEDGYEFFANRRLVTLFSAPNYCGEFDNAGSSNALKTVPKKSETGKV
ncbi:hypothetical protein OPV22_000144 [Ensete ventricosum]|uniref:protein-serine/threonine phosphatase n=1 Tax=Ensete ventricosum TaxID=4639 RepID=A0AAV8RU86_ENSVE|nr:hypothetical protein OPV22_000144 [Ensete ventricosum]